MTGSYVNSNVDLPMARGSITPTFEGWITQDDGKAVVAVGGNTATFEMTTAAITQCPNSGVLNLAQTSQTLEWSFTSTASIAKDNYLHVTLAEPE